MGNQKFIQSLNQSIDRSINQEQSPSNILPLQKLFIWSLQSHIVKPNQVISKNHIQQSATRMCYWDEWWMNRLWFPHLCGATTAACVRVSVCLWAMRSRLLLQVSLQGLQALPLKHSPSRGLTGWHNPNLLKPHLCGLQLTWEAGSNKGAQCTMNFLQAMGLHIRSNNRTMNWSGLLNTVISNF